MENDPEFIASLMEEWSQRHRIEFIFIQHGKPTQNAFAKRFNGAFRRNELNAYLFESLQEVRYIATARLDDYNHDRPHDALGGLSPVAYAKTSDLKKLIPDKAFYGVGLPEIRPFESWENY